MLRIVATRGEKEYLSDVPLSELPALLRDTNAHVWIDSWGTENQTAVELARDLFHFDPLVIDDCFEAREHPKVEGFEKYVFMITHGLAANSTAEDAAVIELDVFLGQRFLFTYHELPSRSVAGALELVERNHGGPLRRSPGALLHAILDRQVDSLAPIIDNIEERIEHLESRVVIRPTPKDLGVLLALKRTTLQLRRWMSKQRDVTLRLSRNEFELVRQEDAILFRDIYDQLHRMTDLLENHREMITSLQDTYLSVTNLRLGEVMKFLTVFTAALMPLTIITGIYGMNFEFMPEIHSRWGYPVTLALMAFTVGAVLLLFRYYGWIGRKSREPPES